MINKLLMLIIISFLLILGCEGESSSSNDRTADVLKEETVNLVPVEALVVKERLIEQSLPLTGVLVPNNSVDIVAEVSGKVISIKSELGDYVNANQTLAVIDDIIPESQFKQAEALLFSAENNLEIVLSNVQSDKMLFENEDISELEYNNSQLAYKNAEAQHLSALAQLSAAKKTYDDTKLKSPISGFVSRKKISYGSMVNIGTIVYRVVDLSKLKINVSVPQEIINRVRIGAKATINISALNGNVFNGVVKRISPQADESSGGFMIEILVANNKDLIKAGMTAKIELLVSKERKVFAIPDYALVSKSDENFVYKIDGDFAELVKIDVGESVGQSIIIENGLSSGDKIVVVGMKNLGLKTKIKVEKLN